MLGLLRDPTALVYIAVGLLIGATIHEFAHAYVADRLGDPTPRHQGRLTLNPLAHLDPVGSLMILFFGLGWAKPVQINPTNFSDWRRDTIIVAAAGPLANITLMFIVGMPFKLGLLGGGRVDPQLSVVSQLLAHVITINAVLAIFNLIPVPPLDGSKILIGLLSPSQAVAYARLQPYGMVILLLLVVTRLSGVLLEGPIQWLVQQATGTLF